jgi:hypothetical protein
MRISRLAFRCGSDPEGARGTRRKVPDRSGTNIWGRYGACQELTCPCFSRALPERVGEPGCLSGELYATHWWLCLETQLAGSA